MQRVEQLEVWREAHTLVLETYELVSGLPDLERFGLISQMRRAAVSIPANIAEGFKRRGVAEKIRFYNISEASLEELRYYFLLCRDLGYEIQYDELSAKAERLARMLQGAINAIRADGPRGGHTSKPSLRLPSPIYHLPPTIYRSSTQLS